MTERKDLLGNDITELEQEILHVYTWLKSLEQREELTPCIKANVDVALGAMWQVVNDLDLEWEHLYELGV